MGGGGRGGMNNFDQSPNDESCTYTMKVALTLKLNEILRKGTYKS